MSDVVDKTIEERGKVYGEPKHSHTNIGLAWTGLIQQHYGITLDHPIPAFLVALMLVDFKMSRAARVYQADNFIDGHAYVKFADDFQKPAEPIDPSIGEGWYPIPFTLPIVGDKVVVHLIDGNMVMGEVAASHPERITFQSGFTIAAGVAKAWRATK